MNDPARRGRVRRAILASVLVLGVVSRVWLALVNEEANDRHLPVIRIIAFEHRFPAWDEKWEAFQPKLYHLTAALVWRAMGSGASRLALVRAAQLVSCAAGLLTLLVVVRFLRERAVSERARALVIALAALNPGLVGVSAQATNDAFVILFGSLTVYYGARFFTRWRGPDFVGACVAALLAGISKGNGLVVIVAVLATCALVFVRPRVARPGGGRRAALAYGLAFAFLVAPAVAVIGPYADYQRRFGSPFVTNIGQSPAPHLFRQTFEERPGLTSMAHGLLTFRLVDLLEHPASTADPTSYPAHRTSLWTRIYAHTFSIRFEGTPPSWKSASHAVANLTRILFLLGLVPSALLVLGAAAAVRGLVRGWRTDADPGGSREARNDPPEAWPAAALLVLTAAGYLAFVALYSVRVRDYSTMKQIFVLPGLLGFVAFTAKGIDRVAAWSAGDRRRAVVSRAAITGVLLVALANAVDVALLIRDLSVRPGEPRTAPPQSRAPGGADSYGSEDEQPDKPGAGVTAPSPATQPRAARP
jgi:dolichyl-phosphate-mannose-protein mannosyltransferase